MSQTLLANLDSLMKDIEENFDLGDSSSEQNQSEASLNSGHSSNNAVNFYSSSSVMANSARPQAESTFDD